jgi:hypothetical protein
VVQMTEGFIVGSPQLAGVGTARAGLRHRYRPAAQLMSVRLRRCAAVTLRRGFTSANATKWRGTRSACGR